MDLEQKLAAYAELVRVCPHNLLSKRDLGLIEERHIPECLAVAERLPSTEIMADVGSGGGFPGIVIAISRPDLQVHLIESTKKKAEFLFDVGETLGLDIVVHNARAEELGAGPLAEAFPLITARAVARLPKLLEWSLPLLLPGGELWAIKGDQWKEEVREARQTLRNHQASVLETPEDLADVPEGAPKVIRIVRD